MRRRNAFTMVELIWVIVVLGIVASLGAEMIANVYKQYVLQRALQKAESKTELAALQIANRLRYAIHGTLVAKTTITVQGVDLRSIPATTDEYDALQWVGADGDSFEAITSTDRKPGWSGFCDLNSSTSSTLKTPGSNLALANTIIGKLSGGNKSLSDAAIYFPGDSNDTGYTISGSPASDQLSMDDNLSRIVEHYKLAWSSYALSVENGNLYLYYNFTPQKNASVATAKKSLLIRNISVFKFRLDGQTLRFKICKSENFGGDFNVTACKEKAVF